MKKKKKKDDTLKATKSLLVVGLYGGRFRPGQYSSFLPQFHLTLQPNIMRQLLRPIHENNYIIRDSTKTQKEKMHIMSSIRVLGVRERYEE